jgi:flavin reductase (DIM6/NTAB) family NADH-FMN oxidoreductase RutF
VSGVAPERGPDPERGGEAPGAGRGREAPEAGDGGEAMGVGRRGQGQGVERADFRRAAGRFGSGIAVVTTSLDGVGHAMTVTAFTSVSLEPLLVLFCAEKIARFHDAVLSTGLWAVSVLGEDSEKIARWLATRGRPLQGQLDAFRHHAGALTGAPILDDALAAMECRTTAVHDGGDHSIVVGEVISVSQLRPDGGPLLHYAGRYWRLGST